MTTFITSDQHFGHRNILQHCQRPFSTVTEMNESLSRAWNARVGHDDEVWHLGDFTLQGLEEAQRFFSYLNGYIRVLSYPWHHDKQWLCPLENEDYSPLETAWPVSRSGHAIELEPPMVVLRLPEYPEDGRPRVLTLCHYPMSRWEQRHHNSWHIFGHSHGRFNGEGLSIDAGVDATVLYNLPPYAPGKLSEYAGLLRRKQRNYDAKQHGERDPYNLKRAGMAQ